MALSPAPRILLRQLRAVMAEPVTAQERLDKIVTLIANNMVAEVCSVYVSRADGALELYATEGLNREAVHLTTLLLNEGLVGLVARNAEPLNISDAQNHVKFSYKPETGEELYNSFLGVPILRNGQAIGVLVVQNSAKRAYLEEEVEALETTAMVLSEMIATGQLSALALPGQEPSLRRATMLKGVGLAEGLGLGHVVLHEPRIEITKVIADNPALEKIRLETALEAVREDIDEKLERLEETRDNEHRDILEAYRMFAHDKGWLKRMNDAIIGGVTAEAAVERVQNDNRARMMRMTDPYLRERLHDLEDLGNRLLRQLTGRVLNITHEALPENAILVARHMGPAALLDYARANLRGLILEEAGATSHVAIVARALNIPTIGEAEGIITLADQGDAIILDATTGEIFLRPTADIEAAYAEKVKFYASKQAQYAALREVKAVTQDGVEIILQMNAGLLVDIPQLHASGAQGIGLFRTELQFMVSPALPKISQQASLYRTVLEGAEGKPVTFRTLDIGGDKVLPYMRAVDEENPAMGWRALRLGLDRPVLLRGQLRALLRAAKGNELRIMFPMVSTLVEFEAAKAHLTHEIDFAKQHGHELPSLIRTGAMFEVPSLLYQMDDMMKAVDFISVGSNDLMQFFFAVDRGNTRVGKRYDTLDRAFLRALKEIAVAGKRHHTPVTLCGEMGSRPLEALALIGLGYRSLSLSAAGIGAVKALILSLETQELQEFMAMQLAGTGSLRAVLKDFAQTKGYHLP
jgi:phosphotransferase system, enzyme I, PtsP